MRILTFTLLSFSLFLFSCAQEKKAEKPDYLIDENKMVGIMVDMHIVETAANLKVFRSYRGTRNLQVGLVPWSCHNGLTEAHDAPLPW